LKSATSSPRVSIASGQPAANGHPEVPDAPAAGVAGEVSIVENS
jgi:hypothetical protein